MKILHIIDSMHQDRGGPPQVCANLMFEQCRNHQLSIGTYTDSKTNLDIRKVDGLKTVQVVPNNFAEKFLGTESRKALASAVEDADFVHIHNVWESLLVSAASLARKNNVPYIVTPHGMLDPWSMTQKAAKKKTALLMGRRRMLEGAKFIHILNSEEGDGVRKLGIKNRMEIIPNGVDLSEIEPHLDPTRFQQAFPKLASKPFVLFLSRLHYKKGLDVLADVANHFLKDFPDWQFVVAGPDGGAKAGFVNKIRELGIEESVNLTGPIYGETKFSLLSCCEVFCLPSRQEGFSVAILEAMSASKPVSITTHCHFAQIQTEECGFVDQLDATEIAGSLAKLASSRALRSKMGGNAANLVKDQYTWEKVNQRLENLMTS